MIGVLGGTIGLGGAEFRLPLLIGVFGFVALQAVIMNKAMSLMSVRTALSARLFSVQWSDVAPHWFVAANLLAGSLVWAWDGVVWATRMRSAIQYRVLAVLLVAIADVLIGVLAALMGAAGGELLIRATAETRASGSCGRTSGSCWRCRPGRSAGVTPTPRPPPECSATHGAPAGP